MVLIERPTLLAQARPFAVLLLILILVSAAWVESDAYRYSGVLLFLLGLLAFARADPKPAVGWMSYLCIGWALYVAARMGLAYLINDGGRLGTSEGIYLFPALYSTIGYALARNPDAVERSVPAFIVISLAALLVSVPALAVFDGGRHDFLFTENTIHSSVSGGIVLFAALNFAGYAWRRDHAAMAQKLWLAAAYAIVVLCAIGIYGAKSKGVWLAVAIGIFVQLLLLPGGKLHKRGLAAGALMLAILAIFVAIGRDNIWASIGPTLEATSSMLNEAERTGSLDEVVQEAIASGSVPASMNERLMLWANAVEVWSQSVIFGKGVAWEKAFLAAHYKDVGYNLLHNGYLEVGVRYGLAGLGFYALLFAWSIRQAYRAFRQGLIPREAFNCHCVLLAFFLATILTNSNNRLAMGEAYMMAMAAFGFYCDFRLRDSRVQGALPRKG